MPITYNDLNKQEQAAINRARGTVIRFRHKDWQKNRVLQSLINKGIVNGAGVQFGIGSDVEFQLTPLGHDIMKQGWDALWNTIDSPEFQAAIDYSDYEQRYITADELTRLQTELTAARELADSQQAVIDGVAAHLKVEPDRNMFYLTLGSTEYGACIKPEDHMRDFPFMVSLRPIAEEVASLPVGTVATAGEANGTE